MRYVKKIADVAKDCVACGCCIKVCPVKAIVVHKGIRAVVNSNTCIGCGKCAKICPADAIRLQGVKI